MKKEMVIIAHPEREYSERLSNYINEHGLLPFETVSFSEKRKMLKFAECNPVAALLIPVEWKDLSEKTNPERKILFLTEEETIQEEESEYARKNSLGENEDKDANYMVCRYHPADYMAGKICEAIGISPGKRRQISEKTKLIGIYSPVGRCLKTSFSLTLGQMLANRYRVLYLNFENYSGFGKILGYSKPPDMADLLYYFLNLSDEFAEKMEKTIMQIGGMDVIPPALSFLDIESIQDTEWDLFLDTLIEKGNYDYILLDLSDYVKGLYEILLRCSFIYTMVPGDGVAMAKVEQYEVLLSSLHYGEILNRTRKVSPPVFRKLPIHPEELIHSELAEYTKKVTEDDFHWNTKE